jgi:PEP-CTERM motif/Lectin C-type domain
MKRMLVACVLLVGVARPAAAVPILWDTAVGGNGHYYEYISTPVTWDAAAAAAASSVHLGLVSGYLATITSAAEQAFILANVTNQVAWLGGNDRGAEGVWRWVTGPEAGSIFFGPGAPVGAFVFWAPGEPNNCCGGEDDLVFGWGAGGSWNDIGLPAFPTYITGYVVEYNAVPEPATLLLVGGGLLAVGRRFSRRLAK